MDTIRTPEQAIMASVERALQTQRTVFQRIRSPRADLRHEADEIERRLGAVTTARALFRDLRADKRRARAQSLPTAHAGE